MLDEEMKVAILAIDGLDATLVRRWRLRGYLQKFHGVHDVRAGINPDDPIYTPLVWASFLLGEPACTRGFTHKEIARRRGLVAYGKLGFLFTLRLKIFGRRNLHLRKLLMKFNIYDREKVIERSHEIEALPREYLSDTLPEVSKERGFRVWVKEFPSYREVKYSEWRARASEYIGLTLREKLKVLNERLDYSKKLLNQAIEASQKHDLILYYTSVIDWANHKLYRPRKLNLMTLLASYYKKVEKLISRARDKLRDFATLIVSDHGYDPEIQEHSSYGFWSLNVKPPEVPRTILDFKDIILELLAS